MLKLPRYFWPPQDFPPYACFGQFCLQGPAKEPARQGLLLAKASGKTLPNAGHFCPSQNSAKGHANWAKPHAHDLACSVSETFEKTASNLRSDRLLAMTGPLVLDQKVLIGYALSSEEGYCANLSLNEFISICNSISFQVNRPRIFHGLKRIWEFLDEGGLRTDTDTHKDIDIHNITDTKLLADLLDPDSARPQADNGDDTLREEGLTLALLASRYLGEDYPYRNTEIHEDKSVEAFADILAHDARIIYRLAAELPCRMSKELYRLYPA